MKNEIAQSEAANGVPFAKYWLHNAFLNIDNKKMSKSLGNFFTVREIGEKYDLQVLRFFMLSAHYRSPLNFSADLMEAAKSGLERIVTAAENLQRLSGSTAGELSEAEKDLLNQSHAYQEKFEAAMDDDFNTADAVSACWESLWRKKQRFWTQIVRNLLKNVRMQEKRKTLPVRMKSVMNWLQWELF